MGQIDRIGTFVGTITESAFSLTGNNNPQWIVRLLATKRYVTDKEEMAHFQLTEPAYVDWNFDESIVGYLVLFTQDKGAMKNYEQLKAATGWDGKDFQNLADGSLVTKQILFRVEQNDNGKGQLRFQVGWIDAPDAPPERTIKSVESKQIADMTKQFLTGANKAAAPAKPTAAKPAAAAAPKSAAAAPTTPPQKPSAPAATTSAPAPSTAAAPAAAEPIAETPKKKTPPSKKTTPPPAAPVQEANGLPTEITKDDAWEYLNDPAVKGENDDTVIEDAWIAATAEVGPNREETTFTNAEWAQVRNIVMKDLDMKAK